jgi:hypothetical protein
MVKRKNTDQNGALRLWLEYNQRAFRAIDRVRLKTLYLAYEDLCRNPAGTSDALSCFLDQPISRQMAHQFIDPKLARSTPDVSDPDIDARLLKIIDQFVEKLNHLINQ